MLRTYARLTFGSYVIKPCKRDQKMKLLSFDVTSESRCKSHVGITLESCFRLTLNSYVIKPCKSDQNIT